MQERMATRSSKFSLIFHILPVLLLSLLLNIPKYLSLSSIGLTLQKIPQYLKFILFFQAFHPITTTGLAPLLILCSLNYRVGHNNYHYAQLSLFFTDPFSDAEGKNALPNK